MKKRLTFALVCVATLALSFALVGCDSDSASSNNNTASEKTSTASTLRAIPLGGSLPDFQLEGSRYGDGYQEIEVPDNLQCEGADAKVYYCENCNTPYIVVYHWDATGDTLEDSVKASVEEEGEDLHYEILSDDTYGEVGYYYSWDQDEENFYYVDVEQVRDGDDAYEICIYGVAEEVALTGSDLYIYLPKGYEDKSSETEYDIDFYGSYDDSYHFPTVWIDSYDGNFMSYEKLVECWSDYFEDGKFPISEEKWAQFTSDENIPWSEEILTEYYDYLDYKYVNTSEVFEICNANVVFDVLKPVEDETKTRTVTYISTGERTYEIWFYSELEPFPAYTIALTKSIHTK